MLKNLGEALSRLFAAHPQPLTSVCAPSDGAVRQVEVAGHAVEDAQPGADPASVPSPAASHAVQPALTKAAQLRQQRQACCELRYAQVHALVQQGVRLRAMARQLHLSRGTVRTYARAATAPIPQARGKRASRLAPYVPYLLERWNAGCHVGTQLLREIEAHWLGRVETSGLGELRSFAGGIRRDYAAVKAALTLAWSTGIVEGNINRLK